MIGNIYISGPIGTFDDVTGVELIDIVGQVKKQPLAESFDVHINSEGGLVDVGFDIYHYLVSLGKPVTTIGSGIVASIATVIFMAGTKRIVRENTPFMIHLPWGGSMGTADELAEFADQLRAIEKKMTNFYIKALNVTEEAILPLLKNETWLTSENLASLGFTTAEPVKAVAKTHFKPKLNDMTENDKNFMESLFNKVLSKFKGAKAKLVQDATGVEIDFPDLADDATVEVGAKGNVDGKPAEGDYTLPDGSVYKFTAGSLTEIVEVEEGADDEVATLKAENERLAAELEAQNSAHETQLATIKSEVLALKKSVTSKFVVDGKKDGKKTPGSTDRTSGIKDYLKSKNRD